MTKLAILILGLTLAFAPARASEIKTLALAHDCGPISVVMPVLRDKYGEQPFALGTAYVTLPDDRTLEGVLLLSVNPQSRSYTVNIVFEEDEMMCMLTSGEEFSPADLKPRLSL
jgi:hypothetical protein